MVNQTDVDFSRKGIISDFGTIMFYNVKKKLGAIRSNTGSVYYFHGDTELKGNRNPKEDDKVYFTYEEKNPTPLKGFEDYARILTLVVVK